jgi:CheY-like chemotaxis protein
MNAEALKHLLLIEDNPGDVRLVELAIQRSSLPVKISHRTNGEEALDFLLEWSQSESREPIELIILDLNLPRKDGFEVLRTVKAHPKLKSLPVLIFTSSEAELDVKKAFDLQADGYILKGPTLQDFRASLIQSLSYWLHLAETNDHAVDPNRPRSGEGTRAAG